MPLFARKSLALATASVLILQACATQQPAPPLPDLSQLDKMMKAGECNPATAALIGAALGAMIADENRARGAAIGAGLGALACYIINAQSKQTRPPAEVEGQYRADHQGTLPEQPLVTAYDTAFNAGGGVKAGQEARVVSSITLVSGSKDPVRDVVEVLEVFEAGDPAKVLLRAEKKADPGVLTGGIQNSFSIRLPEGMAAGSYPARTALYVNGKLAGENRGALRVLGTGRVVQM
ncbi:MAG TPA: hypothetical protein VLC55_01115 [Burkholderiales bacterium]|nr:hypothetical protein [Burkholderiales bacterium]